MRATRAHDALQVEGGETQGQGQGGEQVVVVDGQPGDDGFGVGPLASDARLLLGEQLL